MPDSSVASRSAAATRVWSIGSQCPPSCTQRPNLTCRQSSTREPVESSTNALAVTCPGRCCRLIATGPAASSARVRSRALAASGLVGCQPSSSAVASACSAAYASGSVVWAVGPVITVSGTPPLYERVLRTLAR